jgi:hypothetical protein
MLDYKELEKRLEEKIDLSEKIRSEIRDRIIKQAQAVATYDKAIAITMIRLSAGQVLQIEDGETTHETGKVIASNLDKIARGVCWKQRLEMETAEGLLKSALKYIEANEAEMTALQSLLKGYNR